MSHPRTCEGSSSDVSFAGITTRRSGWIEFTTGAGAQVKVRPEARQMGQASTPVWLRSVRYFLEYLPARTTVKRVRVRDRVGRVIFQGATPLSASMNGAFHNEAPPRWYG